MLTANLHNAHQAAPKVTHHANGTVVLSIISPSGEVNLFFPTTAALATFLLTCEAMLPFSIKSLQEGH